MGEKRKTTVYLDQDLLRAAKVRAARRGMRDSEVMEAALRQHLGYDVLEEIWSRNADLTPEEADRLAQEGVAEVRAERRAASEQAV